MSKNRFEGIPIPDLKFWAGAAAYSLLIASSGDIASFLLKPEKNYFVALPTASINDVARRIKNYFVGWGNLLDYKGKALLITDIKSRGKGPSRMEKIIKNLCVNMNLNNITVEDLAKGVADSLSGSCPSAMEPVEPLSIIRTEFYKYSRFFMPYPSSRNYEALNYFGDGLPALVQAIGLLGHISSILINYKENNNLITRNLITLPRSGSLEEARDATKLYKISKIILEQGWKRWRKRYGVFPWQITTLTIAGVMVQEELTSSIPVDLLVEASLTFGRRITLTMVEPVAASALYVVLNESYKGCTNVISDKRIEYVQSRLSTLKVQIIHPLLATILGAIFINLKKRRDKRGEDPNRVNARLLIEYTGYMYNYASSYLAGRPQRDYAFNAARTAGQAMQTLAKYGAWWWSVLACIAARSAKLEPKPLIPM